MSDILSAGTTLFTRRNFLSTSSTAVSGAVLSSMAFSQYAFAAGGDEIKIALVGCGGRGSGAANQALNVPGNRLVAVADAFQDRLTGSLENLKREHGAKVSVPPENQFVGLDGYKKAIALADVVILATPPGFRPQHFEEAVRQGKHVFMEKPVAVDGPGVRRVLAAAEEAKKQNLKVGVGLQRHHQAGYLETMKRLHDGAIGDIYLVRAYWNDGGVWVNPRKEGQTELEFQMRNWYYFISTGSAAIILPSNTSTTWTWLTGSRMVIQSRLTGWVAAKSAPKKNTEKSSIIMPSSTPTPTAPHSSANAAIFAALIAMFPNNALVPKAPAISAAIRLNRRQVALNGVSEAKNKWTPISRNTTTCLQPFEPTRPIMKPSMEPNPL